MPRTNSASNALLEVETDQKHYPMAALTNSGDNKTFTSGAAIISEALGDPKVLPNGLDTGGEVTPGTGNDAIDVAALTCYLAGIKTVVSASAGETVTRAPSDTHLISSITVNSAGAIAVVAGTESTAFSETRGAAGGPPYIPVGSIEIAQVRLSSGTAAPVTTDEIFSAPGTHLERADRPVWDEVMEEGKVKFATALPLIHTGDLPKGVYAELYEPLFTEVPLSKDFKSAENTYGSNSDQVYRKIAVSSTSITLGQGSFTSYLKDGITDTIAKLKGKVLWFRFYPDADKTAHKLILGTLGMDPSYPAQDNISGAFTITAKLAAVDRES